jgi:predicted CXXCH cytochrome family protein
MNRGHSQFAGRCLGTFVTLLCLSLAGAPPVATRADKTDKKGSAKGNSVHTAAAVSTSSQEDPAERDAFAAMINETDQHRRKDMAERFLTDYPQSWMLAPVYDIASKASLALGDLRASLDFGAKSLRILPENPFLLLPMADAQTRSGLYDAATRSAQDALWYLERFGNPTSIDENVWPKIKARSQAESYFDIGRVAATEGLAATGDLRSRRLADAEAALLKVLSFDAGGDGAVFMLGMVYLGDAHPDEAAGIFARAARSDGPVRAQALDRLHALYDGNPALASVPFDQWVASLKSPLANTPDSAKPDLPKRASAYAGSEACRSCHAAQHTAWQHTGMARMFRPYRASDVIGDFTSGQILPDDTGKPAARAILQNGRHYVEIRQGDRWNRYPVDYLIGSKFQQAYATRLASGEIQVFPLQYNRVEKRWVNYWKIIDSPESTRTDISRFGETNPDATYQLTCATCHTSQEHFEAGVIRARTASFREAGINCEMCHGPSAAHVAAMSAGRMYQKDPADAPVDFKRISAPEYVAICSQCHMQSGQHEPEPGGAMNYSESGEKFYRILSSTPLVDYPRKVFYKDGRFRETTFIVESFVRSKCFREGGATCGNCHDPHPADAGTNLKSVKFAAAPNQMCLGCHVQFQANPEAHTHHAATSEASRCVSCHMPRIMNSLLFAARYHQIDDIPDAEMTARFGQAESPNACLMCHKDRDAAWLTRSLTAWKEKSQRAAR